MLQFERAGACSEEHQAEGVDNDCVDAASYQEEDI